MFELIPEVEERVSIVLKGNYVQIVRQKWREC